MTMIQPKCIYSSLIVLLFITGCAIFTPASTPAPPIVQAAFDGNMSMVQELLAKGADVNATNRIGATALELAVMKGRNADLIQLLLVKGADVNHKNNNGVTALESAVNSVRTDIVQLLLRYGANVDTKNKNGVTPLMLAAQKSLGDIAQILLRHGGSINQKSNGEETALHQAAFQGHADMVRLLLNNGADATLTTCVCERMKLEFRGATPARFAEINGHAAVANILRKAESGQYVKSDSAQVTDSRPVSRLSPPPADVDTLPSAKAPPRKNAYAVVIGIEQYREKLPKADFADRDAKLMGEYLTKVLGYPEENVIVRLNERATRTDLVKYFEEWLRNNVDPGGSVFVYYSGHGAPNNKTGEAYLVPYDGDPAFVDSTAYPVKQLYAALEKLPAKEIVVVMDSCFSGAGGRSVIAKGSRPMVISAENPILATGKTVVLAASSGDQVSSTFEEKGHGLLTYYFLKGLQGEADLNKDGTIEMAELFEYVKPNVQRVARKQYNNEQTPQLLASPELLRKGGGRLIERVAGER